MTAHTVAEDINENYESGKLNLKLQEWWIEFKHKYDENPHDFLHCGWRYKWKLQEWWIEFEHNYDEKALTAYTVAEEEKTIFLTPNSIIACDIITEAKS